LREVQFFIRPELLKINELLPHEHVREERARRLAKNIILSRRILRPIIVEEESLAVLDGHHRLAALKTLGARYAPVVFAKYERDVRGMGIIRRVLKVKATSPEDALYKATELVENLLEPGTAELKLVSGDRFITLRGSTRSIYWALEVLREGYEGYEVVAEPPPLSPEDVLKAARASKLFPPRSSLHLTWLKEVIAPVKLKDLV
jgi:hypothetical protein